MNKIFVTCIACAFLLSSCSFFEKEKDENREEEKLTVEIKEPSLAERIEEYAEIAKQKLPPVTKETMISATNKLRKSDMSAEFLSLGDKAPNFELDSFAGEEYELYEMLEDGPVIISFYRGGWCPYCNLELQALNEKYPEIRAKGAQLVAISPEIPERASILANKHLLDFPLLYDKKSKIAKKYNLVFELDDSLKTIYKNFGIDLELANDDDDWELPVPATYIIGQDKKIKFAFADVDYKKRAEPSDLVQAL